MKYIRNKSAGLAKTAALSVFRIFSFDILSVLVCFFSKEEEQLSDSSFLPPKPDLSKNPGSDSSIGPYKTDKSVCRVPSLS